MLIENPVSYADQGYENYFYGTDLVWEKKLSIYENEWKNIIQNILSNQHLVLDDKEKNKLKEMICFQKLRTRANLNNCTKMAGVSSKNIFREVLRFSGHKYSEQDIEMLAEHIEKQLDNSQTMQDMLNALQNDLSNLEDLDLIIIRNNTSQKFIFSDNPVIIDNVYQPIDGLGYDCAGIIFLLPISPDVALLVTDTKMYSNLKNIDELSIIDNKQIEEINYQIFMRSNKIVLAKEKESIQETINNLNLDASKLILNQDLRQYTKYHSLALNLFDINKDFIPFVNKANANFTRKPDNIYLSFVASEIGEYFVSAITTHYFFK